MLASLPACLADSRQTATLCRVPAFLAVSMRLDGAEQLDGVPEMDLTVAGSMLALFIKRLPLELFSPQMKADKKLDNRSRLLVNCYRYLNPSRRYYDQVCLSRCRLLRFLVGA